MPTKAIYEVICTYTVEGPTKAARDRHAGQIAQTLARTGVTRSSGPDGHAELLKTTARFKRNA
jgi:hypothetical protein